MRLIRRTAFIVICALAIWRGIGVYRFVRDYAALYDSGQLFSQPHETWLAECIKGWKQGGS